MEHNGSRDRRALERSFADLLDATCAWILPAPPTAPWSLAEVSMTGMPLVRETTELRIGPLRSACWLLAVPTEPGHVALAARPHPFSEREVARGLAFGRLVADLRSDAGCRPPHGPGTSGAPIPPVEVGGYRIRSAGDPDRAALLRMHSGCSDVSLRNRFFGAMPVLRGRVLDHLVGDTASEQQSLVVEEHDGRVVAVGNIVATPNADASAEMGILVADGWQRRGIGTVLLHRIREVATHRGWPTLTAETLAGNVAFQRLVATVSEARRYHPEHGTVRIELPAAPLAVRRRLASTTRT